MSADLIRNHLLAPLGEVFPLPKSGVAMAQRLAGYMPDHADADALEALARRFIENRKAKSFPAMAEMIDGLRSIPQARRGGASVKTFWHPGEGEREAVQKLRGTAIADMALAERWAPALVEFTITNVRPPVGREVDQCRAKSRENDALAAEFKGGLRGHIVDLRQNMHRHAERLLTGEAKPAA